MLNYTSTAFSVVKAGFLGADALFNIIAVHHDLAFIRIAMISSVFNTLP